MPRKRNNINIKKEPFEFIDNRLIVRVDNFNIDHLIDSLLYKSLSYSKEWHSKYNSYVIYDYEPFCVAGFEVHYIFNFTDVNDFNFFCFELLKALKPRVFLEDCLLLEVA